MENAQFNKVLASVEAAALNDVVNLTSDRIRTFLVLYWFSIRTNDRRAYR